MSLLRSHAFIFVAALLFLIVISAGCGAGHPASGGQTPTTAATTTPPSASPLVTSPGSPSASAQPSLPAAPAHFKATSITFVSSDEAFCLGTAPGHGTLLVRTLDRGWTWVSLAAPKVSLGRPGTSGVRTVWGTRFASPSHGFVFGHGLWETSDGGRHWALDSQPSGSILSLATIDGQVLALVGKGTAQGNLGPYMLLRRPLAGGSWGTLATLPPVNLVDPTDLISTQAGTAAVLDSRSVLLTTNGGLTVARRATPGTPQYFGAGSVAVTSPEGLALLCVGPGFAGGAEKLLYTSPDGGVHWSKAGTPSSEGDVEALAGSGSDLVLATASGASWLDRSIDGGRTWTTVVTYGDGGMGWADLGFTTPADAVVVHGPADNVGNSDGRPGQLLLSSNGGATWQAVRF